MRPVAALHRQRSSGGRSFLATSLGLVIAKLASMGTGFLFWLLAARAADPAAVGLAAGAVALMMLGTHVAIAGTGSAFILNHTKVSEGRQHLLDAAVTIVLVAAATAAALALLVISVLSEALRPVASQPVFAVLFVAMTVLGTLGTLLDHVSIALERTSDVVVRNCAGGLLTAAPLLAAVVVGWTPGAEALFGLWVLGGVLACGLGARQLHRRLDGYTYRPRLPRSLARVLLRTGLPNHALTLVERTPALLLPAVVTEVLSPELNAYWYVAWMMAWAVLYTPVSVGLTLFARVARDNQAVLSAVRKAAQTGAVLGLASAAGAALVGPLVLGLLGAEYRDFGTTPLRVLVLGVLPVLVIQLYYAVCRARARIREAVALGTVTAVGSVVGPALVAAEGGLTSVAVAWLVVQVAGALVAGVRLWVLLRAPEVASAPAAVPPLSPSVG